MTTRAPTTDAFDAVTLEILWSRLSAISDEIWTTIRRTGFSPIITSALDYGCAVLDTSGGQVAHATVAMPAFNLALPSITRDLLRRFGSRIFPGDVFVGNDPWLCCGHLQDLAVITPVFLGDRLVAFTASIGHQADFGGAYGNKRVREVYEEGLLLPVMKLYERGEPNTTLFQVIEANVRTSELVFGDIEALVAANNVGACRLLALMSEYGLADLTDLATEMQDRSERAMRAVIRALPDGTYYYEGWADGLTDPIKIPVTLSVRGDEILVDYTGVPTQFEAGGLNCTLSYTTVDTHYLLKCVLAPDLPHNEGSTRPLKVHAPEGTVLNCTFPASVNMRHFLGWRITGPVLGALAQVAPDRVMAGPGTMQTLQVMGRYPNGRAYNPPMFTGGGRGGGKDQDGIGAYVFSSGAANVSVEVFEVAGPALVVSKEWAPDSAGAGQFRGGPGQRIVIRRLPGYELPVRVRFLPTREQVPAQGFFDGKDGNLTRPTWNGAPVSPESDLGRDGWTTFRTEDDELAFYVPSGGGYGDPRQRDPAAIEEDLRLGIITPEGARRDYGYRSTPHEGGE